MQNPSAGFVCRCGRALTCEPSQAGTVVRCPACGALLDAPLSLFAGRGLTSQPPATAGKQRSTSWGRFTTIFVLASAVAAGSVLFLAVVREYGRRNMEVTALEVRDLCAENLRTIGNALQQYCAIYGGGEVYPPGAGCDFLLGLVRSPGPGLVELLDPRVLCCPGTGHKPPEVSYRGPQLPVSAVWEFLPRDTVIVCDDEGNHAGGIHVLFIDGRVEWTETGSALYHGAIHATKK